MAFDALQAEPGWQAWNESRSTARCPGGETMAEAAARAVAAVEDIAAEAEGKTVAAVTHCDIIRGILAHYLGLPLDHLLRFDVDPASLSRIEVGAWGGRVGSINERLYQ
jgi:broad specificity phosphatase PhoE